MKKENLISTFDSHGVMGRPGKDWLRTFQVWDIARNKTGVSYGDRVKRFVEKQDYSQVGFSRQKVLVVYGQNLTFANMIDFAISCGCKLAPSTEFAIHLRCAVSDQRLLDMCLQTLVIAAPIQGTEDLLALSAHKRQCRLEFFKFNPDRIIPKRTGFAFVV